MYRIYIYLLCRIDDIEGNSRLRRGIPGYCQSDWLSFMRSIELWISVAHHVFGVSHVIDSANFVYFQALQKVVDLAHPVSVSSFSGMSRHTHTHTKTSKHIQTKQQTNINKQTNEQTTNKQITNKQTNKQTNRQLIKFCLLCPPAQLLELH